MEKKQVEWFQWLQLGPPNLVEVMYPAKASKDQTLRFSIDVRTITVCEKNGLN